VVVERYAVITHCAAAAGGIAVVLEIRWLWPVLPPLLLLLLLLPLQLPLARCCCRWQCY
jgi:hypothetical protein